MHKESLWKKMCNNDGFAIIEVLLSMALISIAFMALSTAIWRASQTTRSTAFSDGSVMAGQESIEMLSIIPIDNTRLDGTKQQIDGEQTGSIIEWIAWDGTDSDSDNTNDFITIAVNVFRQGQVRAQVYYRRPIN